MKTNKNQSSALVSACLALSLHALLESVSRWIFWPEKHVDKAYLHHSKEAALLVLFLEPWKNTAVNWSQRIRFPFGLNESVKDHLRDNVPKGNLKNNKINKSKFISEVAGRALSQRWPVLHFCV